jgi:hypothetical protein
MSAIPEPTDNRAEAPTQPAGKKRKHRRKKK